LQLDSTIGIPPNRLSGQHKGFYGDQVVVALPFAPKPVLGHHVYKAQVFFILIHKEVGHVSYLVIFAVKDASTAKVVLRASRMFMFRQHNDIHLMDTPPSVILGPYTPFPQQHHQQAALLGPIYARSKCATRF
jgi:hypothetical protein